MKINIQELPPPPKGNRYFYTLEKALHGGYVLYIELESDLNSNGTLNDPEESQHWRVLTLTSFDPDQLELNFKDS